jgi:arginyl-tRNA synthetase
LPSLSDQLSQIFGAAFASLGLDPAFGAVTVSDRPDLGQFQVNGALPAAGRARQNPRELAQAVVEAVAEAMADRAPFAELSVAGPGFINVTLADAFLVRQVEALAGDPRLGVPANPVALDVLIDFGGPNVAKPLHVGHLRSAIIGDSLQRLFRFAGDRVVSDVHLGDWGTPMGLLIVALAERAPDLPYFDPEHAGPYPDEPPVSLDDLEALYPAAAARAKVEPALQEAARQATAELQAGRPGYRALWRHFVQVSVAALSADYARLGVGFDLWLGESDADARVPPMIGHLESAGQARRSDGALVVEVAEPGDRQEVPPLILVKSDGAVLYGTTDLATIEQRVDDYDPDLILYVVDRRQSLHFEQVFRAARKTGLAGRAALEHIAFGTMNGPDGKPFRTREGGVMRLADLLAMVTEAATRRLDEAQIGADYPAEERAAIARSVGLAALKFGDLANHRLTDYVFDLERFSSFEGRTGPYLLYTAVRVRAIARKAAEQGLVPGALLEPVDELDRDLMLQLCRLPDAVRSAYLERAPNHLAEHAFELATRLNAFYHRHHILREPDAARQAGWLALALLSGRVLEEVLDLLGLTVPDRM